MLIIIFKYQKTKKNIKGILKSLNKVLCFSRARPEKKIIKNLNTNKFKLVFK